MHGHREGTPVRWGTVPCPGMDPAPLLSNGPLNVRRPPNHRTGDTAEQMRPKKRARRFRESQLTTAKTYAKAIRYIEERRIDVLSRTSSTVVAHCSGDHGDYTIVGTDTGWQCNCPAHGTCSHVIAVEALTYQQSE